MPRGSTIQPKEPLICTPPPDYPFQQAVVDLFNKGGNTYIAYACRLTGWLEIAYFSSTATSGDIIGIMSEFFHRFGIPEELSADGGTNLDSK